MPFPSAEGEVPDFYEHALFVEGTGDYGRWDGNPRSDRNPYAHEVGHFFGLADGYYDFEETYQGGMSKKGVANYSSTPDNDKMGSNAFENGVLTPAAIKALGDFAIKNVGKDGKGVLDASGAPLNKPSLSENDIDNLSKNSRVIIEPKGGR